MTATIPPGRHLEALSARVVAIRWLFLLGGGQQKVDKLINEECLLLGALWSVPGCVSALLAAEDTWRHIHHLALLKDALARCRAADLGLLLHVQEP